MPEWLRELLTRHNSSGLVDTLAILVGAMPSFQQLPANTLNTQGAPVAAQAGYYPATGDYMLQLAPRTIRGFGRQGTKSSYSGYTPFDPAQTTGDRVLAHEFGHLALIGSKNPPLAARIEAVRDPNEERYADDFQNAIQFLRQHQTDLTKLSPKSQQLARVLLQEPIYKDHPLNKGAFAEMLAGRLQP